MDQATGNVAYFFCGVVVVVMLCHVATDTSNVLRLELIFGHRPRTATEGGELLLPPTLYDKRSEDYCEICTAGQIK